MIRTYVIKLERQADDKEKKTMIDTAIYGIIECKRERPDDSTQVTG